MDYENRIDFDPEPSPRPERPEALAHLLALVKQVVQALDEILDDGGIPVELAEDLWGLWAALGQEFEAIADNMRSQESPELLAGDAHDFERLVSLLGLAASACTAVARDASCSIGHEVRLLRWQLRTGQRLIHSHRRALAGKGGR